MTPDQARRIRRAVDLSGAFADLAVDQADAEHSGRLALESIALSLSAAVSMLALGNADVTGTATP